MSLAIPGGRAKRPGVSARRLAAAVFAVAAIAAVCAGRASAGYFTFEPDDGDTDRTSDDYLTDFNDSLPDDLRSKLADGGSPWQALISETLTAFSDELFPALGSFGTLCAVCVICAVVCTVAQSAPASPLSRAAPLLSRCAILLACAVRQIETLGVTADAIGRMTTVTSAFVPALAAICAASGNVTSAALGSSGFAMLCALAGDAFAAVCLPALRASLALTVVAGAAASKIAGAVAKFIRGAVAAVCTVGMTVFVFVFNLRMGVARSADGALYRAVRLAVSSIVPVVGGPVADAGGQLGASLSLIRTSCGSVAVCAVLVLTVPVFARLACDRASLFACRHILGALSPESGEEALGELGAVCTLEIAVAVSLAVSFVLCLYAFVSSAGAIA